MLEVSTTLRSSPSKGDRFVGDHVVFPTSADDCDGFMVEVDDSLLLDYIDFTSCDVSLPFFDSDGDILPDLEVDPTELLAEFASCVNPPAPPPDIYYDDDPADVFPKVSVSLARDDVDGCCRRPCPCPCPADEAARQQQQHLEEEEEEEEPDDVRPQPFPVTTTVQEDNRAAAADEEQWLLEEQGDESKDVVAATASKNGEETTAEDSGSGGGGAAGGSDTKSSSSASADQGHSKKRSGAAGGKNSHGKRKVDWTPELHRRFVQAVEQLGIDKAVPSRILEIMGMDSLTRHNIASHLQKYRSHRKHLMAREAEAATWAQKRHMYAAAAGGGGGGAPRKDAHAHAHAHGHGHGHGRPWVVPTIGFPPPPGMPQPPAPPFCRPLHVWGHPPAAVEVAAAPPPPMLPVWPRHLAPPRPLPPWAHQHPPAVDPAYWQQQYNAARKWGPHPQAAAAAVTQGTPFVPPPAAVLPRFPVPHPMYSRPTAIVPPPPPPCSKLAELQLDLDTHPSKESIDAAIGDVLVKPWLPLPLGLKPPSLDSVMSELHKHGIPNIPPPADTTGTAG